jgi:hypothetical protein
MVRASPRAGAETDPGCPGQVLGHEEA